MSSMSMDTDSEDEIFFGPVTDKERLVAHKFYEKYPGELRISSGLTYGIPGSSADVLPDRNVDESSPINSTVSEDLKFIMVESNQSIMLETNVENPLDAVPDRSVGGSSVSNPTVSEDTVVVSDKNKHGTMLETNTGNPLGELTERSVDGSSVSNPTVSEDTVLISDKSKHGVMLETNIGNPSDELTERSVDGSSVSNPTVSEDTVFISDKSKHGVMLETNIGNPSDELTERSVDGSSVSNPTVSEDTVFISDKSKHGIMLETNIGNPSDELTERSVDGSSVSNPTVSEDTVFISDKSKHGVMLETNIGNPSGGLAGRILVESSVGNSTVSEDVVFISDESKCGIMLETSVANPSDILPDRILDESSAMNSAVCEDEVYMSDESSAMNSAVCEDDIFMSDESSALNSAVSEDEVYMSDKPSTVNSAVSEDEVYLSDEPSTVNSAVSGDEVYMSDEPSTVNSAGSGDEVYMSDEPTAMNSAVSGDEVYMSDEYSTVNSTVSEDEIYISDENKHVIMLETNDGNASDGLPGRILVESSVGNSTVSEDVVFISDESKCGMLETSVANPSDKLEGETSDGSSLSTEKMLASQLHDECFCITLEIDADKPSDFEWLQDDSHFSEALVSPVNDGSKLVMLSENTKDESSEGNYISQASAPPQNVKSEHNTLENAEIQLASQVSEERTEDDVVENLSVEFAYRLGEAFLPPEDYITLEGNVSGSMENGGEKIIDEESLTIVDSKMSEDGIQIAEDCEGMENIVSSGKCSPDKTSSNKEVEDNQKEMSNIFSRTLTIDDSKDIQVPEFCLRDEEEPENELNSTLDLVNTIMLENLDQSCSPSKLADLKRSIQHSVVAAQHRHDTVNLVSDDDYSFTGDNGHPSGDENDDIENRKDEYVYYEEKDSENNKDNDKTNNDYRNVDPILDVVNIDKKGSDCYSYNDPSHAESNNDVAGSNNDEDYTSSEQKKIEHKFPDVEIPVKCPPKFGYSSCRVKPRSPASRAKKQSQKSPGQKVLHVSTPRYRELQSPLQAYLSSEPTLIQVVKPKSKTPRHMKNFRCLQASPGAAPTKQSSVCPKVPLRSPNTLPVVRYTSRPTVDISVPGNPIAAMGPCERVPGTITPIVTKHIGHVKIVNSGSPLKLAESRLSIVESHIAGRSDTLSGHAEASGKSSPSKIPVLKLNLAGRADHGKPKKEGVITGSKTESTPKKRRD